MLGGACSTPSRATTTASCSTAGVTPTRCRARSRRGCAGRRGWSIRTRSSGPTRAGTASRSTSSCSTSCTSGPSRARGRSRRSIPHLAGLRSLGVTAIELMPVSEFPGVRGWGYDGVYLRAPHHAYGGPDGLAAARRRGPRGGARGGARPRAEPPRRLGRPHDEGLRPVLHRQVRDGLGQGDQLRRRGLRGRARVGAAERRRTGARVPPRRAAAGRRPRHRGQRPAPPARRAGRPRPRRRSDRARDRREQPQRPAHDPPGGRGRPRPGRAVGRRLPPRAAHAPHRRARGLLPRLRPGRAPRAGLRAPVRVRRRTGRRRAAAASGRRRATGRPSSSWSAPRTTTRWATGPSATGCRGARGRSRRSARCCRRSRRCCSWERSRARTRPSSSSRDHIDKRIARATREGRRKEFADFAAFAGEEVPDPQAPETFERSKLTRREDRPAARRCTASSCALRPQLPRVEPDIALRRGGALAARRRGGRSSWR